MQQRSATRHWRKWRNDKSRRSLQSRRSLCCRVPPLTPGFGPLSRDLCSYTCIFLHAGTPDHRQLSSLASLRAGLPASSSLRLPPQTTLPLAPQSAPATQTFSPAQLLIRHVQSTPAPQSRLRHFQPALVPQTLSPNSRCRHAPKTLLRALLDTAGSNSLNINIGGRLPLKRTFAEFSVSLLLPV